MTVLTPTAHAGIFDRTPAEGNVYVSGFIGGSFPGDVNFEGVQAPATGSPGTAGAPATVNAEFDTDIYYGGAVGARLPFKFLKYFQPRLEAEVSYQSTDVSAGSFNGGNQTFSGNQSTFYVLVNSYSDIIWEDNQRLVPYVGGGIGVGVVETDIQYFGAAALAPVFRTFGDSTNFATVSTLGVTAKVSDKIDIFTEGRYSKIYGVDVERRFIGGGSDIFNANLDDNPGGFSLTIGTRLNF